MIRQVEGCGGAGERAVRVTIGTGRAAFATVPPRISSSEGKYERSDSSSAVALDGHARLHVLSEGADARILTVEHHGAGRCGRRQSPACGGSCQSLPEAVQLVTQKYSAAERNRGLTALTKRTACASSSLSTAISVIACRRGSSAQQRRGDTAHKVRTGAVIVKTSRL